MSDLDSQGTGKAATPRKPKSVAQKCVHVAKVIVFLITFGYAFPHIFSD